MEHELWYFVFQRISKLLLIIPVMIIVAGLVMRYGIQKEQKKGIITVTPTSYIASQKEILDGSSTMKKFNLQGPLTCLYSSKEKGSAYQVKAYVKNQQVFLEYDRNKLGTSHYLFTNDCLYIWEKIKGIGTKTCGLTPYISLFEKLANMPFFDPVNIISQSDQFKKILPIPINSETISNIMKSCKQEEFKEKGIFEVPKMPWLRPTFPSRYAGEYHRR